MKEKILAYLNDQATRFRIKTKWDFDDSDNSYYLLANDEMDRSARNHLQAHLNRKLNLKIEKCKLPRNSAPELKTISGWYEIKESQITESMLRLMETELLKAETKQETPREVKQDSALSPAHSIEEKPDMMVAASPIGMFASVSLPVSSNPLSSMTPSYCPQCGTLTPKGTVCDLCGYLEESPSASPKA